MLKRLMLFFIVFSLFVMSAAAQPGGNSALSFTDGNKVFNGGMNTLSATASTVEFWLKPQSHSGTIFARMNFSNESNTGIALEILSSSQWRLSVGSDGARNMQNLSVSVSLNTWHHVAVTFNSGTAVLYVDGVSKGSSSGGSLFNSTYPFSFGSFHPWGDYGLTSGSEIDDIRIFNSVRTPSEITSDMSSSTAEGALAFWNFDEAAGDYVYDGSGNENTGFLGTVSGSADANDPSWAVTTGPDAVSGLFAMAGNETVDLKWNQSSDANFAGYYIYGGTSSNPTEVLDTVFSIGDTSLTISGLTNNSVYYFRIRQKNNTGSFSDYSAEDAAVPVLFSGNALVLDGIDDYVNMGNSSAVNINGDITLEAWVYMANFSGTGRIISKWGLSSGYELDIASGNLRFSINQSVGVQADLTSYSNEWIHVAATKSGTSTKIYVNGSLIMSGSTSTTITSSPNNLLIGEIANLGAGYLNGKIDEVRIWNIARTSEDIAANMNSPLTGDETGLIGLWHFDEPSGSIVYDASPNQINGTISSSPVFELSGAMGQEGLPVELTSFTASAFGNNVLLNWVTASETNNSGWEVERRTLRQAQGDNSSNNSGHAELVEAWSSIGFVSGKGTTTEKQSYQFMDSKPSGKVDYRLKQVNSDGSYAYSAILSFSATPETFSLEQNYPNPFNPNTAISYQLSAVSRVKLVVFDLLGREVVTLVNEEKPAGSHSVNFSALNLPSGVYFYKLTAGSFSETKKMTVVK